MKSLANPYFYRNQKTKELSYLDELNEVQRQAVERTEGPVMIIAGPGSGKTRVLTYRIAHLLKQGASPFNILSLTFTNKAAKEMKARVEQVEGLEARSLWIGTFHSVFARILRREAGRLGYPPNFSIYDTQDAKNLIKSIVKELNLNTDYYKPNIVYNRISSAKNALIGPVRYARNFERTSNDEASGRPRIKDIYAEYAKRCFMAGAMDFDDLLFKMYELLAKFEDIRQSYQDRFKYIMIDEFQDTNHAQYEIVRILAEKHKNVAVVGDDAQSIYAFRGANIQNILNFEKEYKDLVVFKLEQNYRSTKEIVNLANQVIKKNKNQLKKSIWTDNGIGQRIKLLKAASDNEEGFKVADTIKEIQLRKHFKNKEFAILYRTNAQSRAMEDALRRQGIPYAVYGGTSFYQRKEVKDLLAYLKLLVNPKDEESLKRIVNYPTRGIGATTLQKCQLVANQNNLTLWEVLNSIDTWGFNKRVSKVVTSFTTMIRSFASELKRKDAYAAASAVAKDSGLLGLLYNDKSVEGLSRFENLQELLNSIKEFVENDDVETMEEESAERDLGTYLQSVVLMTDQDQEKNDDTVKLMTIHASKGLEFKAVFVVGLEEELFPSRMAMGTVEDLEEERRLFYVAVTRAEDILQLSFATTRYRYGSLQYCKPSRFIDEIDATNLEYVGLRAAASKAATPPGQWNSPGKASGGAKSSRAKMNPVKTVAKQKLPLREVNPSDYTKIQLGMKVEHPLFGKGQVIEIEGAIATVEFGSIGEKRIYLPKGRLEILN